MTCDRNRRRFLSAAALAVAAAPLGAIRARAPQSASTNSFGDLKQIDAGVLRVGYAELGPQQGSAVVLLHGWPYDIHSYVDVAPLLASAGYRVIVPYLRGYGTTRFLASDTPRNGQQAALAADTIALMDALADRQSDRRRLRLGRANREHRLGVVAGPLQRDRVGQRVSDREPRGEPVTAAAAGRTRLVVPGTTSRPSEVARVTTSIDTTSRS